MEKEGETEHTEGRVRAWLVCGISFMVQFIANSFFSSFGPMYVEILRVFKVGDATTGIKSKIIFSLACTASECYIL